MKTPRDVLLARHEGAAEQLDAISRQVLGPGTAEAPEPNTWMERLRVWLWPGPVAWGSVSAVWVLIAALNFASAERPEQKARISAQSPDAMQALREQRQLLAELVNPQSAEADADRSLRRPRSEGRQPTVMA